MFQYRCFPGKYSDRQSGAAHGGHSCGEQRVQRDRFSINTEGVTSVTGLAGPTGPEGKSGPSVMQPTPREPLGRIRDGAW